MKNPGYPPPQTYILKGEGLQNVSEGGLNRMKGGEIMEIGIGLPLLISSQVRGRKSEVGMYLQWAQAPEPISL